MSWAAAVLVVCVPLQPSLAQSTVAAQQTGQRAPLNYAVETHIDDGDRGILSVIRTSSILVQHQKRGVPDFASLVVRARTDKKRLMAALYGEARYAGSVSITLDGAPLDAAITSLRSRDDAQPVAVRLAIKAGPQFRFGNVVIDESRQTDATVSRDPGDYGLVSGDVARSNIVVAAIDKIVEQWRGAGFPFARIGSKEVAADHARQRLDVTIAVDPGAPAVYGWINVVGPKKLRSRVVAEQSALRSGAPYNPKDLARTRERLRKLDSIRSVRIIEGRHVDGQGGIPITLEVAEHKARYVGVTASVTTLDGAEAKAHWGHRNLFGGGEQLRVEGAVSQIGSRAYDELEFDVAATLTKPGVLDIDTNLHMQFRVAREANDVYLSDTAIAKVGLQHRYGPHLTGGVALEGRFIREEDETGKNDYALVSLPANVTYDTRDNRLDPSMGIHAKARLAPTVDTLDSRAFFKSAFDGAGYWALDADDRVIVAARVQGGSILGSSIEDIPSTYRFLAGGGNSVRGYAYRSIGAIVDGRVVSGLSYAASSVELRLRATQQFGVVPFIDIATVSLDRVPRFSDSVYVGAGVGLRYYTAIGPIRFDAAVPLTNRDNRSKFGVYVGLGQAF
ncbi:MAG: autotransporter assembly complex protein TamA [Hyphomicrobiaceae bacterium]